MKKFLIILFCIPLLALAQQKLSIEKLWQLGRVSDPQISPDGKTVLYGVRHYDVKANRSRNIIYRLNLPGTEPKAILDAQINAFSARWRPDGKKITYLSAESGSVQVWEMEPDGSGKVQVSNITGGVNGYKYSPALNAIAYTADVKLDKEVKEIYPDLDKCNARIIDELMYRHWDSWHDYAYSHLFIATYKDGKLSEHKDLMKGERWDVPVPPHGDDDEFNWSPDGSKLAYDCKKLAGTAAAISTNSDIYVYDLGTGNTTKLSEGMDGYDKNPQFSPDGKRIVWLSMRQAGYESDKNKLMMSAYPPPRIAPPPVDPKSSIYDDYINFIEVMPTFDHPVEGFTWANNSDIIFIAPSKGCKQVFRVSIGKDTRPLQISSGNHDYSAISISNGKDQKLVGARMDISSPTELFLVDQKAKTETQLTNGNKEIMSGISMGKVEERWINTTDNKQMLTWVIYPPDFDPSKKYPTLLYCQGGPQSTVSQFFSYRWNFQLMAANGYIVVAPNRRGLPGFGSEWNDAIIGDYGGQAMRDYISAIDEVSKERFVDRDKLGAVGASFGGYSVYWLAGNHNKRFKAFIAHCGMFNMESWYGSTEEMFFANNDNKGPYWSQTAHPNNFDASPHKFVKDWDAPILVIHNEKDYRVPITQGMEAFTAAQIKGVPSRFLYFPDENHWVMKPQNGVLWQRVFFEWLDKWLK